MSLPAQYPEKLLDMADCIRRRLCLSLPVAQAEPLTLDIIEAIRARFGGELLYMPKGKSLACAQRNKAIMAEFDGHNQRALSIRYGINIITIYDIIARAKKSTSPRSA